MSHNRRNSNGIAASGILWQYDYEARIWRYRKWAIRLDQSEGYILTYPEGEQRVLLPTSLYGAMLDAAFWIRRHNDAQG